MIWALLPLKIFDNAKQRLASILSPHERQALFKAMVEDVIATLAAHPRIQQTVIVSNDSNIDELAIEYGVMVWRDSVLKAHDLSSAVDAAAKQIIIHGIGSMLVVHGDLPLLSKDDIDCIINTHHQMNKPALTIIPDNHGKGSNCMLLTPPNAIAFNYGNNSFSKHLKLAKNHSVASASIQRPSAALDIDTPEDLRKLCTMVDKNKKSLCYLHNSGISQRL